MRIPYTIVIATRNRPSALKLSIPRMLGQSRPPAQLIVVDSSDDHQKTVDAVKECVGDDPVDLTICRSERGLTLQRNTSLPLIKHPVVFFPDDDSIWFPNTAEIQLNVYEIDIANKIAAVCAAESLTPPPDWEVQTSSAAHKIRLSHRIELKLAPYRNQFERCCFPDPFGIIGRVDFPEGEEVPDYFEKQQIRFVSYMTGFRMSFRTDIIRSIQFDQALSQYSLCEDIDASFGAWNAGWVVAARKSQVYHFKAPERRENGFRYGAIQMLNRAYIVAKYTEPGNPARNLLSRFLGYKVFLYFWAQPDPFSRDRFRGAREAMSGVKALRQCTQRDARECYLQEFERIMKIMPEARQRAAEGMEEAGPCLPKCKNERFKVFRRYWNFI